MATFCTQCGTKSDDAARYCAKCGLRIEADRSGASTRQLSARPHATLRRRTPRLFVAVGGIVTMIVVAIGAWWFYGGSFLHRSRMSRDDRTPEHAVNTPAVARAATWTHLTPAGPHGVPLGRAGSQSMAYDVATDRLIVFGGATDPPGACCSESQNTWVLSNATGIGGTPTWTKLAVTGPLPPGRRQHSVVYDPVQNRMIIFGGGQFNGSVFSPLFNDVWVLKNANGLGGQAEWLPVSPSGGPPAPREGHGAAYNPATKTMIIFGGANNGIMSVPNDLWVLTNANQDAGAEWILRSQTGDVPLPIEHFALAYHPVKDALAIVGGCCPYTNGIWFLTQAMALSHSPQWTKIVAGGTPAPAGDQAHFGYDPGSNQLILHGLAHGGAPNATWLIKDVIGAMPTWSNGMTEGASGFPSADVVLTGSAYNAAQKKFIVALYRNVSGVLFPEVWILGNPD